MIHVSWSKKTFECLLHSPIAVFVSVKQNAGTKITCMLLFFFSAYVSRVMRKPAFPYAKTMP